jgi:MFS family permease
MRSNRWTIAIAGTVVMLTIGCVYSWAIFTQPLLVAYHWDLRTATWAYSIANFSLAAVGAVIGGFWQDKAGPRKVAMVGIVLWGCGNILAGVGTSAFGAWWLYVTYGIVGGIGLAGFHLAAVHAGSFIAANMLYPTYSRICGVRSYVGADARRRVNVENCRFQSNIFFCEPRRGSTNRIRRLRLASARVAQNDLALEAASPVAVAVHFVPIP